MQAWDRPEPAPEDPGEQPHPADFQNYVSLGIVGYDPEDPTLAFVRRVNGQYLVEVTLADGDDVNAYLCHQQTGVGAGDYIPVKPGESVVVVWPDGDSTSPYIVARLADLERQIVDQVCGVDTTTKLGGLEIVRQFRWLRTVDGQVFAIQSGGEMLLQGGGVGVRIKGPQVVIDGGVHLGADFTANPEPGAVVGGEDPVNIPGVPYIPVPAFSLSEEPQPPQLRDGIVRFQDPVEGNILTDPDFFGWMATVNGLLVIIAAFLGVPWPYDDPESWPIKMRAAHVRASRKHTATDEP